MSFRPLFFILPVLLLQSAFADYPQFTRLAFMGDSITAQISSGTSTNYFRVGVWTNLASRLGQQVDIVYNGDVPYFATGGGDTVSIPQQHMAELLQSNAEACFLLLGSNDFHRGRTPQQTAANLAGICHTMEDHGILPILCDPLPVAPGQDEKAAWLVTLRQEVQNVCDADPQIFHIPWFTVLDPEATGSGGAGDYFDMLHPNQHGMSLLGEYAANLLRPLIRPRDLSDGTVWLTPNPEMNGTGNDPDGWTYDVGADTITTSLIPRDDGHGNWWQIFIPENSPEYYITLRYALGTPGANWAPGDYVEMVAEFETDDDVSPVWNLGPALILEPSNTKTVDSVMSIGADAPMLRVSHGVLRSPEIAIPADNTGFWPQLYITGTGTVRLGRVGIRKVAPSFSNWVKAKTLTDKTPDGDPDGDGISNRLEWILGGDPATADAGSVFSLGGLSSGSPFTFRKTSLSDGDSQLFIQRSTDLVNWEEFPVEDSDIPGPLVRNPNNPELWSLSGNGDNAFFRMRAEWKK